MLGFSFLFFYFVPTYYNMNMSFMPYRSVLLNFRLLEHTFLTKLLKKSRLVGYATDTEA